ncbi:ibr domain containing protein [Stylonychia lemnae]|uniref:RBR-type E3 ubiquitin transferase n=1 Tax=Stylonychia lemnae TaxID=5949 RepID=A0A077ZQ34_STYLE|nr:ibr domain containing protein [Stylonychia lemnae]|eukprot:CDW72013.1 ibr domain containing protein [Stylonychia lemnae]
METNIIHNVAQSNQMQDSKEPLLQRHLDCEQEAIDQYALTKFCEICYEDHNVDQFITNGLCQHLFCRQGLIDNYTYQINLSGKILKLSCPQKDCQVVVTEEFLQGLLNQDLVEKYKKFKLNALVQSDKNSKFCPTPNCENIINVSDTNTKKIKCDKCKKDMCFSCSIPWHSGLSCQKVTDKLFKGWIYKMNAHKCPNCRSPIEKNEGCNHMHCTLCDYHWCWVCGRQLISYIHPRNPMIFVYCGIAPSTKKAKCQFYLIFSCIMMCMPFLLLISMALYCFQFSPLKGSLDKFPKIQPRSIFWQIMCCLPAFVYMFILVFIIVAIAYGFSLAVFPFVICPSYFLNCRDFIRILKNWSSKKRTNSPEGHPHQVQIDLEQQQPLNQGNLIELLQMSTLKLKRKTLISTYN